MFKHLRQSLRPGSVMFRSLLLNVSLLLLVTVVLTWTSNMIYQNSAEKQSIANTMEIERQVQKSLDIIFRDIADSCEAFGSVPEIMRYLSLDEDSSERERVELESFCRRQLKRYSESYPQYLSILLASENGQYVSNDSYRIQKKTLTQESWYEEASAGAGRLVLNSSTFGRNIRSWKNYSADSVISVSQLIRDQNGKNAGVIQIDVDIGTIAGLVSDITMGQTGFGCILNEEGKVLYAPRNTVVYRMNPTWFAGQETGQLRCLISGKKYNVIFSRSASTGLISVGVFDWGETVRGAAAVRRVSVCIAAVVLLIAVVASMFFSATITGPISRLSQLMNKAQEGDLSVQFDNHYSGEIGMLGDAFNAMVAQIRQLLQRVSQEQENKREAELRILHEQIKPHFLYNTLDTIRWMARSYHASDIESLVHSLSGFFRLSLSQGQEYIPLAKEIEMVRDYLDIQKVRYEDLFTYETDVPYELLSCEVLKLSLQPLVENALYHGIKESEKEKGHILIQCRRDEGDQNRLILLVEDDGAGMDTEKMERLNSWLEERKGPEDVQAYGTLNVNERIKIAYGEDCGLRYQQRKGGGTIAVLRMGIRPRREQEEGIRRQK